MSQHIFKTTRAGEPISVLLGWDRPLEYFFLVVEQLSVENNDEIYLYSNLDDPGAIDCSLDYFRQKLSELGISVPDSMFIEAESDRKHNVGNRLVEHHLE